MERLNFANKKIIFIFAGLFIIAMVTFVMSTAVTKLHHLPAFSYITMILIWAVSIRRRIVDDRIRHRILTEYLRNGDYECSGLNADMGLINSWPYELSGDPVDITGDLGRKLNIYLSNFSEQGYEDKEWPYTYAHFVLEWCRINDPSSVKYSNDRCGVDREKMFEILDRFFGTNFEEGDYSLSADEAEKLAREGTLYYAANELAFLEEVEDGYWLISYSVFE